MKWCKKKFSVFKTEERRKVQYGLYMHSYSYACGLPISQLLLLIHIGAWHHTLHHLRLPSQELARMIMRSMQAPLDFTTERKYMRHQALLVSILGVVYQACYNIYY